MTTAKFSRSLIRRIYEHALVEGRLAPGMTVLDPFAGVALGALDAMWNRLNWIGVELEPKFVSLGRQNLIFWRRKYSGKEGLGSARIIQGDSRKLAEVIAGADCCIGSPPFSGSEQPCASQTRELKDYHAFTRGRGTKRDATMTQGTEGQLASLLEGRFEAVISSPPHGDSILCGEYRDPKKCEARERRYLEAHPELKSKRPTYADYGNAIGNLGNEAPNTFWSAAREILIQCHTILKPGGHAIWVTKRFVRAGKIVEFSDQWQALCESVGFRLVCRHRAMLVKNHGEQETIFDGTEQLRTERKSFFRRLAEKKGSPPIDWEDVMCLERCSDAPLLAHYRASGLISLTN